MSEQKNSELPENNPELPDSDPELHEKNSELPEKNSELLETNPELPENNPELPEKNPGLPEGSGQVGEKEGVVSQFESVGQVSKFLVNCLIYLCYVNGSYSIKMLSIRAATCMIGLAFTLLKYHLIKFTLLNIEKVTIVPKYQ